MRPRSEAWISFAVAPSVYRVDLKTRQQSLWGRIQTDIDPKLYVDDDASGGGSSGGDGNGRAR